jgi:hypothetical protein
VTLAGRAAVSAGEADYSLLPQIQLTGQGTPPSILSLLIASAAAELRAQASRRWGLELAARADHLQPLGDTQGTGVTTTTATPPPNSTGPLFVFPNQTTVAFEPSAAYRVSRRDDLLLAAPASYMTTTTGVEVVIVAAKLGWKFRLTPRYDLELLGGLAYGHDLGTLRAFDSSGPISPLAAARLDVRLPRVGAVPGRLSVAANLDYFVDPAFGAAAPRATVTARLAFSPAPGWAVGGDGLAASNLRQHPIQGNPDETVLSVSLPVRRRASENLVVEFGGRFTVRSPSLPAGPLAFHQRQTWLYMTLIGASRRAGPSSPP